MPISNELPSSSPRRSPSSEESIEFYKSQYEQLEAELADFQASSRELETELERDVEAAEKRERQLQQKVESLGFEVDEWKNKYRQAKSEANAAQTTLQKEITTLRDTNRTIQLRLRDIEVANDDFERQARNTTSSLEDLESKYNMGIERSVMLEEEVKLGEQEREALRIDSQRLRDELGDLKIEADIMQDKLRHAESTIERQRLRKPEAINQGMVRPQSPTSDRSAITTASSPTIATPPTKSTSSTTSDVPTPPSPLTSELSAPVQTSTSASAPSKPPQGATSHLSATPRPYKSSRPSRQSRGPSISIPNSAIRQVTRNRHEALQQSQGLPGSGSLTQIRGLIGKMQMLEQRVQSARSKLPAPLETPPRGSPRGSSVAGQAGVPSTITMRSNRKRTGEGSASRTSSIREPTNLTPLATVRSRSSRLSFGAIPTPSRDTLHPVRPSSRVSISSRSSLGRLTENPLRSPSRQSPTRPASRQSPIRPESRGSAQDPSSHSRPSSRQSINSARTPLGHYTSGTTASESRRPRSSIGGSYTGGDGYERSHSSMGGLYATVRGHGRNQSVSQFPQYHLDTSTLDQDSAEILTPTPIRKTMVGKPDIVSAIPTPKALGNKNSGVGVGRRISSGPATGDMGPPERRVKKLSGVGESY